jgi:TDG/mug DNA glycosylase family protein
MTTVLPDLLGFNLDIIFCGTSAGNKSASQTEYYAHKGNSFYETLHSCGFTPRLFAPFEYRKLLEQKIGLTDLAKLSHGSDRNLKNNDYDTQSFYDKIIKFNPKIVCFNGKKAAKIFFNAARTQDVAYGLQQFEIGETKVFVAASTSPRARKYWDVDIWYEIRKYI